MDEDQRILDARESRKLTSQSTGCIYYPALWLSITFLCIMIDDKSGFAIGTIISIVVSIVTALVISRKNENCRDKALQEHQTKKQYMETELKKMEQGGFVVSRIAKDVGSDYALAVDSVHKRWTIIDPIIRSTSQYKFSDLIAYDVVQDGASLMSGNSGAAFIGGMALGTVGAIAGAAGERTITTNCTELYINISVNDIHVPRKKLAFISFPVSKNTEEYKYEVSFMQEVAALLDYIKANSQNEVPSEEPAKESVPADKYQEIEKLNELKEKGIISEEEFSKKKKELLGL